MGFFTLGAQRSIRNVFSLTTIGLADHEAVLLDAVAAAERRVLEKPKSIGFNASGVPPGDAMFFVDADSGATTRGLHGFRSPPPLFYLSHAAAASDERKGDDMGRLNPAETIIRLPDDIVWESAPDTPARSVERAILAGSETEVGQYLVLMKWYPGYMSAPHFYRTDRLCVVLSGVWWCNSGSDFDPQAAVPAAAGSFVKRVAGTPHYDGAHPAAAEPAVIAVTGIGPVGQTWVDPSQPWLRRC